MRQYSESARSSRLAKRDNARSSDSGTRTLISSQFFSIPYPPNQSHEEGAPMRLESDFHLINPPQRSSHRQRRDTPRARLTGRSHRTDLHHPHRDDRRNHAASNTTNPPATSGRHGKQRVRPKRMARPGRKKDAAGRGLESAARRSYRRITAKTDFHLANSADRSGLEALIPASPALWAFPPSSCLLAMVVCSVMSTSKGKKKPATARGERGAGWKTPRRKEDTEAGRENT